MKPYLFGLLTIVLLGLWWYLDTLLATRGWATMAAGGQWTLISSGWGILLAAWPLAFVGVLVGGIPAFFLVFLAWQYVDDKDHSKEIASIQELRMAAEIRATEAGVVARAEAKQQVQAEMQEAEQRHQQAERERERNKQVAAELVVMQRQALADVEQANRRTRNATATSQRRAKKLAKLKKQS